MSKPSLPRQNPDAVAWLVGLIDAYRAQARSTPAPILRRVHECQRLGKPTQFAHIWIKAYPPIDVHFVVAMHLGDLPDKAVFSWGPIEPKDFSAVLEDLDAQAWFHAPIRKKRHPALPSVPDPTRHGLLHDYVDWQLRTLSEWLRLHLFNPQRVDHGFYLQGMDTNVGVTTFHGDLLAEDPKKLVQVTFSDAAGNHERMKEYLRAKRLASPLPTPQHQPKTHTGYSVVLYPARHIGKNPAKTITERLWGPFKVGPGTMVLDRHFGAWRVFATYEGIIGVAEPDPKKAARFLNLVCLALRNAKHDCAYLRPRDLGPFSWRDLRASPPEFSSWSFAPDDRRTADQDQWPSFRQTFLSIRQLEAAFREAAKRFDDPDSDARIGLLEAESHFSDGGFRQAFFLAWIIIEKRLAEVWEHLLVKATGKVGSFSGEAEWKPALIASGLHGVGLLTESTASRIQEFNKKRNAILHGKPATKADATAMVVTALIAILELRIAEVKLGRRITPLLGAAKKPRRGKGEKKE